MNSLGRDAERLGRLFHTQPAEEAQLDHLAFARVDLRERFERLIEREQPLVVLFADRHRLVERHPPRRAASLAAAALAREVYQHLTHHSRRRREEMSAV